MGLRFRVLPIFFPCIMVFGTAGGRLLGNVIRVPADQPSIQAAINAAANGDTVQVAPGTYFENINFLGKAITVASEQGAAATVIDALARDSVAAFVSGEGLGSILNGFTLQNGRSDFNTPGFGDGGGIRISSTSPTIRNNVIKNNQACVGVGISIRFGSPMVQGNTITNNMQAGCSGGIGGGGISIGGAAAAQILNNVITNNALSSANGGGISLFAAGTPTISGNVISGNTATGLSPCAQGGGITMVNASDALIVNNLITGNSAGCGGGVYWLVPSGSRGPFLVNNTISGNSSAQGSGVFADGFDVQAQLFNNIIVATAGQTAVFCGNFNDPNPPIFRFNDIFSASGAAYGGICTDQTGLNGNISADPLFRNAASGDYHLQTGSPAIDAGGVDLAPATDFDGVPRPLDGNGDGVAAFDMGAFEAPAPVVDVTPPITTATPTPGPNSSGWNNTSVTVALSAVDNSGGTGVKQIQFSMTGAQNSGLQVVNGSSVAVAIGAEGTTTLSYNAVDNAGNAEVVKNLTLKIDKTPPVISGMPAPRCELFPANHQLVQVATVSSSDSLSGLASFSVTATSNEPDSGTGGGDKPGDIVISGGAVQLRAERSPSGSGRIYTITATATDVAGNTATATSTCTVPKAD